jgi:hypothetical protein
MAETFGGTSKVKVCLGCNEMFTPDHKNQKRCKPRCSVTYKGGGNGALSRKRELHEVEFIGVDGEGVTGHGYEEVWDEEENQMTMRRCLTHDYVLLSVGDQSLHRDGKVLTHEDIFSFLWEQYLANPNAAFVGFFLGYDFTHWLRSIPDGRAWKLLHKDGIDSRTRKTLDANPRPWPVRVGNWEFDILANKRFMLRPFVKYEDVPEVVVNHKDGTATSKKVPRPWMYICDSGPFFQSSFLSAIDPNPKKWITPVCSPAEFAIIKEGKTRRSDAKFDVSMIRYNILENEILARLMTTVNEGLVVDNIRLARQQWFGPGQAAQKWLGLVGCPSGEEVRDVVPQWARDAAKESFYGGWFEIFAHGVVEGGSYGYDINSAYPYGIANLPCLLHGKWSHGSGRMHALRARSLRLVNARVRGRDQRTGPAPFRRPDGTILRPLSGSGWYWWDELQAAKRAGLVTKIIVDEWVEYDPCDCPPPLQSIRELYEGRLIVGKNTSAGKGKKLIYNSSYGKMAQSVGKPKFSNPIYASRITSVCRSMILDAIATHPGKTNDLLMVATDSVVFKSPHPNLDIDGNRLGAWDETVHSNLSLFMPGVYWDDGSRAKVEAGEAPELKSRGISSRDLLRMINRIDAQWEDINTNGFRRWPSLKLPVDFQMVTAKQAVVRNNWPTCGRVDTSGYKAINADPSSKRSSGLRRHPVHGYAITDPYDRAYDHKGNPLERSTPYVRNFGEDDNNDTDEPITPDGPIVGLVQQAIIPR